MENQAESNNWRATARFVQGMKLLHNFQGTHDWRQLDSAAVEFAEAVMIDPTYRAARFYLGVSTELGGNHSAAAEQFEALRSESVEPDPDLLYNLGLAYFHQYRPSAYRSAIVCLSSVIQLTSQTVDWRTSSVSTQKQGRDLRRRNSIRLLAKAALAQVYSHFSIPPKGVSADEAQKYFGEALEFGSSSLEEFERLRKEKNQLEAELVSDIGWGLHNALGHASLYAGRREGSPQYFQNSIGEFRKALEFQPDNYRVLSNIGSAYFFLAEQSEGPGSEAHLAEAEKFFHIVLQLKPNYDFAYVRLAKIALKRGNIDEAQRYALLAKENLTEMTQDYISDVLADIERAREGFASDSR